MDFLPSLFVLVFLEFGDFQEGNVVLGIYCLSEADM